MINARRILNPRSDLFHYSSISVSFHTSAYLHDRDAHIAVSPEENIGPGDNLANDGRRDSIRRDGNTEGRSFIFRRSRNSNNGRVSRRCSCFRHCIRRNTAHMAQDRPARSKYARVTEPSTIVSVSPRRNPRRIDDSEPD